MEFKTYLKDQADLIENNLPQFLTKDGSLLSKSMKYSLMAGGKRLRPILVLEAAKLCGGSVTNIMPAACALEYIHTYSLIHDDLPAMDNDDLRRGKPTNHKKFGQAAAILAGDALLTDAFCLITMCKNVKPAAVSKAVGILSFYAGSNGMVKGQALDTLEAGTWRKSNRRTQETKLNSIHLNKTAALIKASLEVGAVLSNASDKQINALNTYGENIGLAFQITDDILDIVGNKKLLGKKGSDKDNDKLTYPAVFGLENSRSMAGKLIEDAKSFLSVFGNKAGFLNNLADYILSRQY